jgi:hypothetical protein
MPLDGDGPKKPHYNARFGASHNEYYEPTDKARTLVRKLSMLGVAQDKIALKLGIDTKTLRKHFREDLDEGDVEAFASVAGALWHNAVKNNNVVAQIFWMKARHGWIDRREVNHNHNVGPMLSHEERLKMLEADPMGAAAERRAVIDGVVESVQRVAQEETEPPDFESVKRERDGE